jgi:SNF2 family DNA or RNA helicase
MQVRTGKTYTSIYTAMQYGARSILFITKKKVKEDIMNQWKELVAAYPQAYYDAGWFDMHVTNYESVHKVTVDFDFIILDESHCCGQYPTPAERTKLLKKLAHGLPIIYLSGTPTPESYSQLYHQLWISSFSPWAAFPTFYKWSKEYVTVRKKYLYNREINDYSNASKSKIEEDTQHLFIQFSQADAGFTEYVEEEIINVKMSDKVYRIADKLIKHKIVEGQSGTILADTAVKLQQKLHQIYSGTIITEDGTRVILDDTKATYIKEKFAGQRIAIFYKFIAEGDLLKSMFNWTDNPMQFNQSKDLVFLSQIQSGREGINLHTADALVMYNIDFSAVSYWQSRARLQTRDRTRAAKVYWIFSEGGIEEKVYKVVQQKKDFTLSYFKRAYSTNFSRATK